MRLLLSVLLLTIPFLSHAHGGRTNSEGCHNDNAGGTGYHCHGAPTPTPTPAPSPITYNWYIGEWGECSGDCGTMNAFKYRTVFCNSSNGVKASDASCSGTKPDTSTACTASMCEIPIYEPPKLNQNVSVLRSSLAKRKSVYASNSVGLECIYSPQGYYNARLAFNNSTFSLASLSTASQCDSFSGEFSFITKLLTIYGVDVAANNYRALLELNNSGSFDLIYVQDNLNNDANVSSEYNRDDWGTGWADDDSDCQDTRAEVLANFDLDGQDRCTSSTGLWIDPYTQFEYYNASDLDIDHVVPLKYAHDHGGAGWSAALKHKFYNDIENLLPVSASQNRAKGSKAPDEWMPDNANYHCQYINSFLYVVDKYDLDISDSERLSIQNQCNE